MLLHTMMKIHPSLDRLETAQLIRALTEQERAYFFRHILVQESAYDTLLKQERKNLHRTIALALEKDADVSPAELARHFAAAEESERAGFYFTQAAVRAQTRFENAEALAFFRAALEHESRREARVALFEGLGDVLALMRTGEDALHALDAGLELAREPLTRARLTRKKGDVYQVLLQYEKTAEAYAFAAQELGGMDATHPRAQWEEWILIQVGLMNNFYWHGHWERVRTLTEHTRPYVEQYGTPALRAMFLDRVEMMRARQYRYVMDDTTRELVVAMRAAAEESQDARQILNARFSMAFVDLRRRDLDISESEFLWSIERARELGDALYLLWSQTYLAVLYRWRGDVARVRETVGQSFQVEGAPNTPWYGAGLANLAWVALRENDANETRRLAREALAMWEPFGELYPFRTLAWFPLLELARHENDLTYGIDCVAEILNPSQEKLDDGLENALTRAQEFYAAGDMENARGELARAIEQARRLGFV